MTPRDKIPFTESKLCTRYVWWSSIKANEITMVYHRSISVVYMERENNVWCTPVANCLCAHDILLWEIDNKITLSERINYSSQEYIHYFISYTAYRIHKWRWNDDIHTSFPCLSRSLYVLLITSQSIGDDVTMTRQLWRDYVISNYTDVDFIHGDIHGRSCKK